MGSAQRQYIHNISLSVRVRLKMSAMSMTMQGPKAAVAARTSSMRGSRVALRSRMVSCSRATSLQVSSEAVKTSMQFVKGVDEPCVPEVKLSRAKDGSSGTAVFIFDKPSIFQNDSQGEVTGLYLIDEEGTMQTSKVSAKFVNGKPDRVEAKLVMRTPFEWDRFMRFMERYAAENGLGFTSAQ